LPERQCSVRSDRECESRSFAVVHRAEF
jgi:hypothetical protein